MRPVLKSIEGLVHPSTTSASKSQAISFSNPFANLGPGISGRKASIQGPNKENVEKQTVDLEVIRSIVKGELTRLVDSGFFQPVNSK
jgi:hypothetical protein